MAQAATVAPVSAHSALYENLNQKKIPSLDGLRAVAVLLVIFHHLGVPYAPRGRGVLTFFVLSGFLITWLLLKESERNGTISVRDFYVRRVLRIFPAFYVFWVLHLVVSLLSSRGSIPRYAILDYVSSFFYLSNYWHAVSGSGQHYISHVWALAIEEQFYLLWPLLFAAFQKDLRKLTRLLIAIIAFVDVYRIVLFFGLHVSDAWLNFAFDCRVDHLLVGCLLAVLLKRGVLARFWIVLTSRLWISIIPFGLIIASIALNFRFHLRYTFAVGFIIDPLLTALFLVQVIAWGNTRLWGWLNWSITRYCGRVSYSMFLYHVFGNQVVKHFLGRTSMLLEIPAAVTLAVLAGTVSYYLVEIRFLRLKARFGGLSPGPDDNRARQKISVSLPKPPRSTSGYANEIQTNQGTP